MGRLGFTLRREQEFFNYLEIELVPNFRRCEYDIIDNNCNHFCDQASQFLLGKHLDESVAEQSKRFLESSSCLVRCCRPFANRLLRKAKPRRSSEVQTTSPTAIVSRLRARDDVNNRKKP